MLTSFVCLLLLCVFQAKCYDYLYWRDIDVDGKIPSDALQVDTDVYIGQTRTLDELCSGILTPGHISLQVTCRVYGIQYIPYLIKVMCTNRPQDFMWVKTSSSTFFDDIRNKTPVESGWAYERDWGWYHLGRIMVNGTFIVGNIGERDFLDNISPFHYVYNGTDLVELDSFEALVYAGKN